VAPGIAVIEDAKSEAVTTNPPAPVASPAKGSTTDSVKERLLALVVEKTGYPKDMLDLDLDLEADLGVDTVKQAELFAAIREIYGIPRDESRKLRDYPTLAHVIQFVYDKRPDLADVPAVSAVPITKEEVKLASIPPNAATPVPVAETTATSDSIREKVLEIVAERYARPGP
jgi:acyl carrier protein